MLMLCHTTFLPTSTTLAISVKPRLACNPRLQLDLETKIWSRVLVRVAQEGGDI